MKALTDCEVTILKEDVPMGILKPQSKSEADILSEVKRYLATDNRVLWFGRFNSGKGNLHGRWFVANECYLNTDSGAVESVCTDILAFLKNGRSAVIEVKNPTWKKPKNDTEKKQALLIEQIKATGAIAGFVRSIDELNLLLGEC